MKFNIFKRKNKINNEIYDDSQLNDVLTPESQKMSRRKKLIIAVTSLIMVVILAFGSYILSLYAVKKDYEYVASLLNLPEPIQEEASNIIIHEVDDCTITYNIKANYTLIGRVVEKHYYLPYKFINKLSRFDLGIVWGPLLNENLDGQMSFNNDGNRFLKYQYTAFPFFRQGL